MDLKNVYKLFAEHWQTAKEDCCQTELLGGSVVYNTNSCEAAHASSFLSQAGVQFIELWKRHRSKSSTSSNKRRNERVAYGRNEQFINYEFSKHNCGYVSKPRSFLKMKRKTRNKKDL